MGLSVPPPKFSFRAAEGSIAFLKKRLSMHVSRQLLATSFVALTLSLSGCTGQPPSATRTPIQTSQETPAPAASSTPANMLVTTDGTPATAPLTREIEKPTAEQQKVLDKIKSEMPEDSPEGRLERGQLYLMAGEQGISAAYPLAVEDFSKVLEQDPIHPLALRNRGMAYARGGELEKAMADYEKLIEVNPDDPYGYTVYASLLAKTGNDLKAITIYDEAVALGGPQADGARFNRGNAHLRLGHQEEARKDFQYLVDNSENAQILEGAQMNLDAMSGDKG